jgi:NADPH:quinone reductase-like Zn-dependent oxidoreductase
MAKQIGATVITTVGDDDKVEKAKALGADHVINYRTERFETIVRKLTGKKGVDVAFEHVGPDTFNGSLLCLKRGGRLVTCGSTSGQSTQINLFQLYLQQYRIIGSFACSMRNVRESLDKMAGGLTPVIDTEVALADFESALARLESRKVFGKIIVTF